MRKIILNGIITCVVLVIISIGISLTIKADVGVGSINALSSSVGWVTGIHVGTVLMWLNIICVIVQFILLKKDFHWRNWLQIGVSIILGSVVNVVLYHILSEWVMVHYWERVVVFFCGTVISCLGISMLIRLNLVVAPVESMALVISQKTGKSFKRIRQLIDIVALGIAAILTMLFPIEWSIREGTIINALIFSSIIQFFIHFIEKRQWFNVVRIH